MHIQEKNKKLNIHHPRNATDVMATVPSQALVPANVLLVMDMVKLGPIKVFLQFNKLVLNVEVQVKKFLILVKIARAWVKNMPIKNYLLLFLRE